MARSILFVVSGPSGSGKGEALRFLIEQGLVSKVPTYTTRPKRPNEVDGRDYHFVSPTDLHDLVSSGEVWETVRTYSSHEYGSSSRILKAESEDALLTELDPLGFYKVRAMSARRTIGIFVLPPTMAELERRLMARGTDVDLQQRVDVGREQVRHAWNYDYVLTNDAVENFHRDLDLIVRAELLRAQSPSRIVSFE